MGPKSGQFGLCMDPWAERKSTPARQEVWSWTDTAAPWEALLVWRQRSCDVQAGRHGPSMPKRPSTSVPRRSLRPTVQPDTSPFRRAKSTARTTSPTQHVRPPPGFCHCWSVRLEQSYWTVCIPNFTKSAFRRMLKTFFRTVLARLAH